MQSASGQASVELIAILGISLIVILVFSVLSADFLSDLGTQGNENMARDSVQQLAAAADSVYAQGEGASQIVQVSIPETANMSANASYIGKPASAASTITPTLINIRVGDSDVFAIAKEPLVGNFPSQAGAYPMKVESKGPYVSIGAHYIDTGKNSVFISMAQGESRAGSIPFYAAGNETVTVAITANWAYSNVNLTVSPSSFTLTPETGVPVTVNASSSTAAAGIYNAELTVSGTAGNGITETFAIPVTVDVQAS